MAAARHRAELVAAAGCLDAQQVAAASRRRDGLYSHPARPGRYVQDLIKPLRPGRALTANTENYVAQRVGLARNYGVVIFDAIARTVGDVDADQPLRECFDACEPWQAPKLREWRVAAGFFPTRPPDAWDQPPIPDANAEAPNRQLALRLADGGADPASVEQPHDLLWFADLADALAPFSGNDAATVEYRQHTPALTYDAVAPREPAHPRADSIPLAAAGVAQLVAFGATPPPRCRTWAELLAGIVSDAAVAEAAIGVFPVPADLSTVDGSTLPGTALTVQIGREPRQLAEWSNYMGNCIGHLPYYTEQARAGRSVLMALREPDGRMVANLELRRKTGGWRIDEMHARFNEAVEPDLVKRVESWVADLAPSRPPATVPVLPVPPVRVRSGSRRAADGLPARLTSALAERVRRELAAAPVRSAWRVYADLAGGLGPPTRPADFEPDAALVALRRASPERQVELVHAALARGVIAVTLWRATRARPLAAAVAKVDQDERLGALTGSEPLPRSLRALVRRTGIAPGYATDTVARAVRAAIGTLARDGADVLVRSVARSPAPDLLCALAVAATCTDHSTVDLVRIVRTGERQVPGFPPGDLFDEDGPWRRALPAAAELGAPVAEFGGRGLVVPAALLGAGGWPALWRRAHR